MELKDDEILLRNNAGVDDLVERMHPPSAQQYQQE
jgi:hypothetical protein